MLHFTVLPVTFVRPFVRPFDGRPFDQVVLPAGPLNVVMFWSMHAAWFMVVVFIAKEIIFSL